MSKGSSSGTAITGGTSVSNAKPAVLTGTGMTVPAAGDLIIITGSGNAKIDGKPFVVAATPAPSATAITLEGLDLTSESGAVTLTGAVVTQFAAADLECLCLSSFEINREAPGTISVATFCDPSASVPSVVTQAGTVNIGGFVDISAADFKEVLAAEQDGKNRHFRVSLPGNGHIVFDGVVSGFAYQIPLDGAQSWTAQITLAGAPRHLF
ncbi:MAG: hypothetical protein ACO25M_09345 [Limnohabitans sp.]